MDDRGMTLPRPGMKEYSLWALRRRKRFRVQGDSMRPLLKPGDDVLIMVGPRDLAALQINDIVAARHPFIKNFIIIKKIKSITKDGYVLEGLNRDQSSDSRGFGPIKKEHIIGRGTSIF